MTDAPQCGRMQRDMNRMNEKAPEVRDHELREPSMQSMVQKVIMPMAPYVFIPANALGYLWSLMKNDKNAMPCVLETP